MTRRKFVEPQGSASDFFSGIGMGEWGAEMNNVSGELKPKSNGLYYNGVELFERGIYGLSEKDLNKVNSALTVNKDSASRVCFISFTGWENEHLVEPHECFYVENVEIFKAMVNSLQGEFDLFVLLPVTAIRNDDATLYQSVLDLAEWFKSEPAISTSLILLDNQCLDTESMESCSSLLARACDKRLK